MATPETTWSTPKVTVARACSRPPRAPNRDAAHEGGHPAPLVAGEPGPPGAEDHHPLEADVDHAGPLGEEPAQRGEADRHGEQQRRRHRRRRRQGVLAADLADDREQHERAERQPQRAPAPDRRR